MGVSAYGVGAATAGGWDLSELREGIREGEMIKSSGDDWCKHYNGTVNAACKAGVNYDAIKDVSSIPYRWICTDPQSTVPCDLCVRRTPEEIRERKEYLLDRLKHMDAAFAKIRPFRQRGKTTTGVIECPKCKGRLHYSISGYNGHIHGKCETDGCLSWIQ